MSSLTQQGADAPPRRIGSSPAAVPAATMTPVAQGRPGAGRRRDPYLDNAKYLAILLVAVGHVLPVVVEGSRATRALYMLVYAFHMPTFVLISGHLSRSYVGRPDQLRRLLTGVALPYLVFEVAYTLLIRWGAQPERPYSLLHPSYLMWFLIALFVWRTTAPFWSVVRWPVALSLAIAAAAAVTPDLDGVVGMQRVLQFLPFFVIGLRMRPEHFRFLRRRSVRAVAVLVLAGALPFTYWATASIYITWFYRTVSAQEMGVAWGPGLVRVGALFVCATILTAAFLALVPGRRVWFTTLGSGTLCGYLLHGFLVRGGQYSGFFDRFPWLNTPGGRVFLTVATIAVMTLLCTPVVRRALRPVTEPELRWAFRPDGRGGGGPGRR
ncbi:acyltransferase family protein [Streptomyces sp. NPDC048330]|uniref:acyltransferase family protein n=1 Tax=Streptomyces sp. NPDC048330 TaxID=3365533 RepID=UPI003711B06F